MSKFIWHGKRQRQRFSSLQLPKDKGSLAVPNMVFYNWACHIRTLWTWSHSYLRLETCVYFWACSPESLWSFVTCRPDKIKINIKNNPLIINSIKVWQEISEYMDRWGVKSMLSPICNILEFLPGLRRSLFESWLHKWILVIGDIFEDNILMSFQQLQDKFNHFFVYLQLRHFINSLVKPAEDTSIYSEAEKFIHEQKGLNHVIFPFYLPNCHGRGSL